MKILNLLRHAKSDWGDPSKPDHARPLARVGIAAAKKMGRHLAAEGFKVDEVYASTARRTRDTFRLLGAPLNAMPASFLDQLYLVTAGDLLEFIQQIPTGARSVLIIGHNPALHDLSRMLVGDVDPGQRQGYALLRTKYPTGSLCTIRLEVNKWSDVQAGVGNLARFLRPRELRAPVRKRKRISPRPRATSRRES